MKTMLFTKIVHTTIAVLFILGTVLGPTSVNVAAEGTGHKVGLVFTETGLTDNSFNWMAYQGLLQAQTNLGVTISDYTPASSEEYGAVLQQCADDGNGLCIAVGFSYGVSLANAARANQGTKWGIVDYTYPDCWEGAVEGVDCGSFTEIDNVRGLRFDEKQAGYLAGVLAGEMTVSNFVGVVGGWEIPPVVAFVEGYRNGAQCNNPDVNVLATYTDTFSDPALGADTAEGMIAQGADVIFGAAGQTGNGAILYGAQHDQWAIGVDADQYLTVFGNGLVDGSDKLLSSAMKRVDNAVYQTIEDYVNGDFSSGTVLYDLAMDGVGLAPFHDADSSILQAVKDELESVKQGIIDGTVNIDDSCAPPPPPTPYLHVNPTAHWVYAWYWPSGVDVTLTVGDYTATVAVQPGEPPFTEAYFELPGYVNLMPGDTVTVKGGNITKELEVTNFSVDELKADTKTLSGTALGGGLVTACADNASGGCRFATASADNGLWSMPDDSNGFSLAPGVYGWAGEGDSDGDVTRMNWYVPNPRFDARVNTDRVEGWDWTIGETVALNIDDPGTPDSPDYSGTQVAFIPEGWDTTLVEFDLTGTYDIKPGDEVSLGNSAITKTTTVTDLAITNIDVDTDIVNGVALPGSHIDLWASTPPDWPNYNRHVTADGDGNWYADFSAVGTGDDEQETVDIDVGVWIDSQQTEFDDDGDRTMFGLTIPPPPFIWADPLCECINGWDWSVGDTITIQVFDQNGNDLDLQNPTQVYSAESGVFFELGPEGINLQPGYRITMTNGVITKELLVTKLVVKEMNPVANTITGIYDPAFDLVVYTGGQEPLNLQFDDDEWIASFESVPLDGFGEVYQPDEDGDKTGMGWDGVPRFMRYDIYAFDVESETHERITTLDGTGEYDPSWSPFGKKVAHDVVYWDGSQAIYITDVATGSSHPLKGAVDGGNDAAWSPNGLWIAFDRRWMGDQSIYIVPFTGGQRRLVRENGVSPNWSPNGLRIVYQDLADGGKVKTVGLLGNLVITVADYGENPAWSPDGKWIAYSRDGDIWKVRVGSLGTPYGDPILVANMAAWIGLPTWSDDSATIAFDAGMTDDWDLWSVPAAGGEPTWLTGVPEYGDYGPDYWKNFIAYASFSP